MNCGQGHLVQMRNGVLYDLSNTSFRNGDRKRQGPTYCQQRHDQKPKLEADGSNVFGRIVPKAVLVSDGEGPKMILITHTSCIHCSDKTHRPVMKFSLPDNVMPWIPSRSKPVRKLGSTLVRDVSDVLVEATSMQVTLLCSGIPSHMLRSSPSSSGNPTGACASERQRPVAFFACLLSLKVIPWSAT